ncbi:TonB-dependent receptor [Massilia brevitalea]|uniref:TonB-dependent receptor n=1 Tax=Massilia brevitalea TaxID=442526 RepID=UPI002738F7BB|nr:TonB-dependent receptor [Massilia brevitalea]
MNIPRTLIASAILLAFNAPVFAQATHTHDDAVPQVLVTASPFRSAADDQILTPAKVLAGDELRDKTGSSIGETLSQELGVSASAFGAGASRPVIRGMEGSRVKMLENGMATNDVSGLSNDHAVASEGAVARQIEILRGPAALLYGSGAIGGLVNIVNERIPTALEPKPTGQVETRYGTVDNSRNASASVDGASGQVALHVDANWRETNDYKIPGDRVLDDPSTSMKRLPNSETQAKEIGVGGSWIADWGYAGLSAAHQSNLYGIPSLEGSRIDQKQDRYDFDSLVKAPLAGFESFRFKAGYTDYRHAELGEDGPEVLFSNRSLETRAELAHAPVAGLHGTFGVQTENTHFSALNAEGGPDTVPVTHSKTAAAFLVEEANAGPLRLSAGLRYENVERDPVGNLKRSFDLGSGSLGAAWPFTPGYSVGATVSYAQRAPAIEELYSGGPHDATATFDIGNPDLDKEISRNIELSVQKTNGLLRWKANAYRNNVSDFIYGRIGGGLVDEEGNPGDALRLRSFEQADAHIRGAEAEVTWNQTGAGWSGRLFADTSRGKLDAGGSLPLQPADRIGASIGYRQGDWRGGLSLVHARGQDRLAVSETTATPAYNGLNANVSYTQHLASTDLTWFLLAKNLLDEDIRVSTSVLKDIAPLPGRNFVFGVRAKF